MSIIKGSNVVLYFKDDNIWKPLACARTATLTTNAETGETSTKGTGKWRTYRYTKLNWTISCAGLCSLDMNMTIPKLRQYQFDFTPILINFQAVDDNGLVSSYSGYVLITAVDDTTTYNATYDYTMNGLGSGELVMTDQPIDPNACCSTQWYYYDGVGDEFTTGPITRLVHRTIDGHIFRDGIEYRPSGTDHDGAATPVGLQFSFDSDTGEIGFDTSLPPLEEGEAIDIPYLTCGDTGGGDGDDCVPVTINDAALMDATVGEAYNEGIVLSGTIPIEISGITKPSWMTLTPSEDGDMVFLTGTPDVAGTVEVRFTATNCGGTDVYFNTIVVVSAPAGARFGTREFVDDDVDFVEEIGKLLGDPVTDVTVKLDNVVNSNGGTIKVDGSTAFLNNTWVYTLDGSGEANFTVRIDGNPANHGTVILAHFTITTVSAGIIGTPDTYQVSKVFS